MLVLKAIAVVALKIILAVSVILIQIITVISYAHLIRVIIDVMYEGIHDSSDRKMTAAEAILYVAAILFLLVMAVLIIVYSGKFLATRVATL